MDDLITIVETKPYLAKARRLLDEREQAAVVETIAADPEAGVVMRETGGVRKLRFGRGSSGKSGGVRVVYYFADAGMPVFLLTIFAKNERDNLSRVERHELARLVKALRHSYGR